MRLFLTICATTAATFTFFVWLARWADNAFSQRTKDYCRSLLLPKENARPARFVAHFYQEFMVGLMGQYIATWRFFLTSAAFSCFFMAIFASAVVYKNDLSALNFSIFANHTILSTLAFGMAIVFVCCIDYISFAMTWFFLSLIRENQSVPQIALIGVADVILTSNLFTFLFPLYLMVVAIMYVLTSTTGQLVLRVAPPPTEISDSLKSRIQKDEYFKKDPQAFNLEALKGIIELELAQQKGRSINHFLFSNFQVSLANKEVRAGLESAFRDVHAKLEPSDDNYSTLVITMPEVLPIRIQDLMYLYGSGFRQASSVRIGFWEVARLGPGSVDVNYMIDEFDLLRSGVPKGQLMCFDGGRFERLVRAPSNAPKMLPNCTEWIYLHDSLAYLARRGIRAQDQRSATVAITWFFWSSFGITLIAYLALFAYAITRVGVWSFRHLVHQGYFDAEKSIFHVLALPAASAFSAFFALMLVLWTVLGD